MKTGVNVNSSFVLGTKQASNNASRKFQQQQLRIDFDLEFAE